MALILSVLIATMPKRKKSFNRLYDHINSQKGTSEEVEILWDASMKYNIGVKRNKLLERAKGEMVVFADDDDHVADDYIERILQAARQNPDAIGISGFITTNGKKSKPWHISKDFGRWHESGGVYFRTPNHISPVKREIALQAMFPEIAYGEDYEYSMRILPLIKTETKVPGDIYHYDYWNK